MRSISFVHWLAPAAVILMPPTVSANAWMAGKTKTDRTVTCETTVAASPAEVYRLWTTADGVQRFFAPAARIDARPGGRYEILFAPDRDPLGLSHGTAGARVLRLDPGRLVAFEWIAFAADSTLGRNAPPVASPALRTPHPLPTWVEVRLAPLDHGRTHVTLHHYGFRHGELWDGSYAFFDRAWRGVLQGLEAACREEVRGGTEGAASNESTRAEAGGTNAP